MKKIGFALLLLGTLLLSSCEKESYFKVVGHVSDAQDEKLYLEHVDLEGVQLLDSVVLQDNGKFAFKHPTPEYPDFYRLRLGKQTIPFPIDSALQITVKADAQNFATSYTVEGSSDAVEMKEVWLAQLDANVKVSALISRYNQGQISINELMEGQQVAISEYKELANRYIFDAPKSPVAYFALFQQVGGSLIYNIYDKIDSRSFAIVANVYEAYYPEYKRTRHLYDLALKSVAVVRAQARREKAARENATSSTPDQPAVDEVGYIEIALPDASGQEVTLSSVAKGHVTVLSFTTMAAEWTPQYNAELSLIHQAYADKGVRIYQVGLDTDSHLWRSSVSSLPWTNVRDKEGRYSSFIGYYNISSLPTIFLINSAGELTQRISSFDELDTVLARSVGK